MMSPHASSAVSIAYGNKRSALFHLFRTHGNQGYTTQFKVELSGLCRGFFRQLARRSAITRNDNNVTTREGKEAMSVALYESVAGWLLSYGTTDGVIAFCYLVLTWNLACRAGNTANIYFKDMHWTESFDSFSIHFSHTKTDQTGEESKYARHVYANPHKKIVCPLIALSIYFTCCFYSLRATSEWRKQVISR